MRKSIRTLFSIVVSLLYTVVVQAQESMYLAHNSSEVVKFPDSNIESETFKKEKQVQGKTVTDLTGNVYPTLTIGKQTWMQENLRTEKYSDGTEIPLVTDSTTWAANFQNKTTKPMMSWYNNDKATHVANKNGAFYNWYALNPSTNGGKNVCPIGWHVPTDDEWTTLENYLIANGFNFDGTTSDNNIAKALASTTGWTTSSPTIGSIGLDLLKNNSSKFAGLPTGNRVYYGSFDNVGSITRWWSASEYNEYAGYRGLNVFESFVLLNYNNKNFGFSVRCVKD